VLHPKSVASIIVGQCGDIANQICPVHFDVSYARIGQPCELDTELDVVWVIRCKVECVVPQAESAPPSCFGRRHESRHRHGPVAMRPCSLLWELQNHEGAWADQRTNGTLGGRVRIIVVGMWSPVRMDHMATGTHGVGRRPGDNGGCQCSSTYAWARKCLFTVVDRSCTNEITPQNRVSETHGLLRMNGHGRGQVSSSDASTHSSTHQHQSHADSSAKGGHSSACHGVDSPGRDPRATGSQRKTA
jgi:hypothetical protein